MQVISPDVAFPAKSVRTTSVATALAAAYVTLWDLVAGAGKGFHDIDWVVDASSGAASTFKVRVTFTDDAAVAHVLTIVVNHNGAGIAWGSLVAAFGASLNSSTDCCNARTTTAFVTGRRITGIKVEVGSDGPYAPTMQNATLTYDEA